MHINISIRSTSPEPIKNALVKSISEPLHLKDMVVSSATHLFMILIEIKAGMMEKSERPNILCSPQSHLLNMSNQK